MNRLKITLDRVVHQILQVNLKKLRVDVADVRSILNPENIHEMRVAARRLRAAIKIFRNVFSIKTKKIRIKLKKAGTVFGKKRDLDIFSEFIFHFIDANSLLSIILNRQRDRFGNKIVAMLGSQDYHDLIKTLERLKPIRTRQNFSKIFEKPIGKASKMVLKIAPSIESDVNHMTLHKLRIAIKKLRYVCEFSELFLCQSTRSLVSFIEKLKKIQDILGEHQDAITGILILTRFKSLLPVEIFLKIKKKYELKKLKTRNAFFKIWKKISIGVRWKSNQRNFVCLKEKKSNLMSGQHL